MAFAMTTLRRAPNGDWFGRKGIPADVRPAYRAAHGVSVEERFRRSASLPLGTAKQELREWDAMICSRIEAFRAAQRGEGWDLTTREMHGLAGQWYAWFLQKHESEPGDEFSWDAEAEELEAAYRRFNLACGSLDADDALEDPAARRHIRSVVSSLAEVPEFMAHVSATLSAQASDTFLDTVELEYVAALRTMSRRVGGDFSPDADRLKRFPEAPSFKSAGLTCWGLFEGWVRERNPAPATVNRWRSVFLALKVQFGDRDIASISEDEARTWKGTLVTAKRSAKVVNEVWLRAARVVFGWASKNKRIEKNPFDGVAVAASAAAPKLRDRDFNDDEWQIILRASLQPPPALMSAKNAAARRWVPWLCGYTGSRPGEVTQLRAEDFTLHKGGFWAMRITPEAGTVKGGQARTVPIHPHLVEQGLIAFVQAVGAGPLFYDPETRRVQRTDLTNPARGGWIKARDKLSDWVRKLGVTDPGISPNHAWRHTFKRRAARSGIEKRIRWAMCGHSDGDVGDEYETPSVVDLAHEMKRFLRYELDAASTIEQDGTALNEQIPSSKK